MNQVRVWDWPTRIFHWSLALLFVALVVSAEIGENAMVWHFRAGYAVCCLLLFRFVWGFVGGYWSRWRQLSVSIPSLQKYLRQQNNEPESQETYLGHNPLGSLSVIVLLSVLSLQVATGLFSDDDIANAGPLTVLVSEATVQWATFWHAEIGKLVLFVLVGLHIGAIAWYFWKKQNNLLKPMLTGDKFSAKPAIATQDGPAHWLKALLVLAFCAALVYVLITLGDNAYWVKVFQG
jgi:cytochrome b